MSTAVRTATQHSQRLATILSLVAGLAAGGVALLARDVSAALDFRVLVLARSIVAFAIASVMLRRAKVQRPPRAPSALLFRSLVGSAAILCNFYVFASLPSSNAVVLLTASPIWVATASRLWLGQRWPALMWVAIALVWGGIVILERPQLAVAPSGVAIGIVAGVLLATVMMTLGRLRALPGPYVVAHFSATSILFTLALSFVPLGTHPMAWHGLSLLRPTQWLEVAAVCALGALNQLSSTRAYQIGRASRVAVVALSQVPFVFVVEHAFLGGTIAAHDVIGVAMVLLPLAFIMSRPKESKHVFVVQLHDRSAVALDPAEHARVTEAIARFEGTTSCEARVHVDLAADGTEAEALATFDRLAMHRTVRRNGVLVLVARAGRVVLVADEGIGDVVPRRTLRNRLAHAPSRDDASWGEDLAARIEALAGALVDVFPPAADDVNELPDDVSVAPVV